MDIHSFIIPVGKIAKKNSLKECVPNRVKNKISSWKNKEFICRNVWN